MYEDPGRKVYCRFEDGFRLRHASLEKGAVMTKVVTLDGYRAPVSVEPDAHGQAALLLTESLLHTLVDKGALSNGEAIEAIEIAAEVKYEVATSDDESRKRMDESLELLTKMRVSFQSDER